MKGQLRFDRRDDFRKWLEKNHDASKGVWLVFEKGKDAKTISARVALEEALCFGWIDGQIKRISDSEYIKRFTPRRNKSKWSERNKGLAEELEQNGRMTDSGRTAIDRAKENGMWNVERAEPNHDELMAKLEQKLRDKETAFDNYLNMPISVRKTYAAFYADAKKEPTRKRRLERITDRLAKNLGPM